MKQDTDELCKQFPPGVQPHTIITAAFHQLTREEIIRMVDLTRSPGAQEQAHMARCRRRARRPRLTRC